MPRADKESTLARQWELMRLIPSRTPGRTVRELCEALEVAGYSVTKRTVERDLADLAGIFPLQCNAISKPYGWHWEPGAQLEIPGMDLTEALSLGLLEEVLRPLVPESFVQGLEHRFRLAREKLAHLPDNPRARWSELVRYLPPGLTFLPPTVVPGILREVQEGLLHGRCLRASYRSAGKTEASELELHPLALIQQGVRSYLLATAFDYEKPLLYALHRFDWVEVMPEKAKRPAGFTLDDYLNRGGGQFGEGKIITLKAELSETLASLLGETPLSSDQKIVSGKGGHRLTATLFDSWQLRFWILSQGADIVVRQPAALRKALIETIEEMRAGYRIGEG
jgi:predicted DNA-binding transcriptional regulator YafY